MKWWARSRLRTRIFIAFSALLLAALIATLGFTQWVVSREAERTLRRELSTTAEVFNGLVKERGARLETNSALLASDFALKRVIATYFDPATYSAETLASAARSYQSRIGVDLLWIADDQGRLLVNLPALPKGLKPQIGYSPIAESLKTEDTALAIAAVDGKLFQLVAVPVLAPDVIGYLVLGQAIDDGFATELKRATGSDISFLTGDRVFASSWPPTMRDRRLPTPGERPGVFGLAESGQTSLLAPDGERFLTRVVPIDARLRQPLYAIVQGSYDEALAPLHALQWRIAAIGAAALLLALLIGRTLAGGITSPLQALVKGMREVVAGNLRYRSPIVREDEVGFLARSFNDMVVGLEERAHIEDTFGRFVSRDVATAVLSGNVPLEGERREVSILFQDIRGFTALSRRLDPAALLRLLNQFFTEMVAAVEAEGGVVKQFIGDGVMALFGAPQACTDHAERAVRAALGMVHRLAALNARLREQDLAPIEIGVGIDTGVVIAGLIGPDNRVEYGVVGDPVNLANRVEALTREFHATVLVSKGIADRLSRSYVFGRSATLPVKGRAEHVEVLEVLAYRG